MTDRTAESALPNSIEELIEGAPRDVVGLPVARILPTVRRRSVGHFVFVDHMGPYVASSEVYVRPHPHIGLATVTYLLDGAFLHKDSLGTTQVIEPGAVNWMTAGKWIVHSERTVSSAQATHLHGIQTWVALPLAEEASEPSFQHVPAHDVPELQHGGCTLRVIAGTAFGRRSPVQVPVPLLYVHVAAKAGSRIIVPNEHEERGVYVASGQAEADGHALEPHQLAILRPGTNPVLEFASEAHVFLLGGMALEPRRFMEWNFVSSSRERIDEAKARWREGSYVGIEGETDVIPLPPEPRHS